MDIVWTKHLKDPEEKERLINQIKSAKQVLDRLNTILDEKFDEMERTELSLASYADNNWSHKQAHKNGYKSCLARLKQLINLDQQKEK